MFTENATCLHGYTCMKTGDLALVENSPGRMIDGREIDETGQISEVLEVRAGYAMPRAREDWRGTRVVAWYCDGQHPVTAWNCQLKDFIHVFPR
jgi:hypothetical protein